MFCSDTILLVEDEEAHVYFIRKAFQRSLSNYHLQVVSNLEHARLWLSDHTPLLTITDLNLPDGSGTELVQSERHEKKPVIIMTGWGNEKDAVKALKAGAIDYIEKSDYAFSEMPHIVERALREYDQILANRRATEEIRKLSHVVEQSSSGLLITDIHGVIQYANPRLQQMTGYSLDELLGSKPNLLNGRDPAHFLDYSALWSIIKNGETWKGLFHNRRKDGTLFWSQAIISPIRDENSVITHYSATTEDVTESILAKEHLAVMEEQLRRAQKMQTIGTLAGGIAHDFNNILTPIFGFTDMALEATPVDNPVHGDLEHIKKAAMRARDLVKQILVFSRQGEIAKSPMQVGLIIKEVVQMMRATLPSTIELKTHISTQAGSILGDPTQIHQVLVNLCTNASHAVEGRGGKIEIRAQKEYHDEAFCKLHTPNLKPGEYVSISVRDNGYGMPKEVIERIFEPFFTTKPVGKGAGLGLSVVHGIISSHKGEILVESQVGTGTVFRLCFPALSTDHQEQKDTSRLFLGNGEKILLVDDEPENIAVQVRALKHLNYHVSSFTQSAKALEAFDQNPEAFDLLITDQTMPMLSGKELSRILLQKRPGFPIILLSGFLEAEIPQELREMGIADFLTKPADLTDLSYAIRRALLDPTLVQDSLL